MDINIKDTNDLLEYLIAQAASGSKQWFGFTQQKITGIDLVHKIAANHASTMTAEEVVDYVNDINNQIYNKIITRKV
jgi:hypothetical protein